jgi:hypothetical protein
MFLPLSSGNEAVALARFILWDEAENPGETKRYISAGKYATYPHECPHLFAKGSPKQPPTPIGDVILWSYMGSAHETEKLTLRAAWHLIELAILISEADVSG